MHFSLCPLDGDLDREFLGFMWKSEMHEEKKNADVVENFPITAKYQLDN